MDYEAIIPIAVERGRRFVVRCPVLPGDSPEPESEKYVLGETELRKVRRRGD
jgi:hypothetical protein